MPDFLPLLRETGLELVFLDFVTLSPICSIPCGATSFLVLILSSADFFLQFAKFYSSEATLDKFYNVNVLQGSGLSYEGSRKTLQHFSSKRMKNIISGTAIDLIPRT